MERQEKICNLAKAIQAGEKDKLPALWDEMERLVKWWCNRLIITMPGADFEDLYQCGYLALAAAVETYKPERGSFNNWLAYYFKNEIRDFFGFKSKDPLRYAESLDAPLYEDSKTLLVETIPDSSEPCEDVEECVYQEQLRAALDRALSQLPEEQGSILRQRFYNGKTLRETATDRGCTTEYARQLEGQALKSIRKPKISRELRQFIEDSTPYYMKVSINRYQTTGTSAVEELVFMRERMTAQAPPVLTT